MKQNHLKIYTLLFFTLATLWTRHDCFAVPAITKWAVIKCKLSGQAAVPAFNPALITGNDGLAGYWSGVSYGQVSLAGSANGTFAYFLSLYDYYEL